MSLVYPAGGSGGSDQLNIAPGIVITVPSTSNDVMVTQNTLESSDGSVGITRSGSGTDIIVLSGRASGGVDGTFGRPVPEVKETCADSSQTTDTLTSGCIDLNGNNFSILPRTSGNNRSILFFNSAVTTCSIGAGAGLTITTSVGPEGVQLRQYDIVFGYYQTNDTFMIITILPGLVSQKRILVGGSGVTDAMSGGVVVVFDATIQSTDIITATRKSGVGASSGVKSIDITPGLGFVINGAATDDGVYYWTKVSPTT